VGLRVQQPCTDSVIQLTKCQPYARAVLGSQKRKSDEDPVHTVEGHRVCPMKSRRINALSNDLIDQFQNQVLVPILLSSI